MAAMLMATGLLAAASIAYAATGKFSGKTSQRQPISLRLTGGYVRNLDYKIVDKCPDGQKLINHDFGFSAIRVSRSRFGGTFVDPSHGGRASVSGSVSVHKVTGTLTDRTRNAKTHEVCTGKATFRLRHR